METPCSVIHKTGGLLRISGEEEEALTYLVKSEALQQETPVVKVESSTNMGMNTIPKPLFSQDERPDLTTMHHCEVLQRSVPQHQPFIT